MQMEESKLIQDLLLGELVVKSGSKEMKMSGFVSTPNIDFSNEIVEVASFEKWLAYYKANPLYLFDHNLKDVIGRVENPRLVYEGTKTGLYLEGITLSAVPIVNEYIWPLIVDKVLSQQSIGFFSRKGQYIDGIYHHQECFLYESSLVPVACNPEATLDVIKNIWGKLPEGYQVISSLEDVVEAVSKGLLKLPSECRTHHQVSGFITMNNQSEPNITKSAATTPDFADAVVLNVDSALHDPNGVVVTKPHRNEKTYRVVADMIHAAKSSVRNSYLFQLAQPTEKGFAYDFDLLAVSMARLLGANGGAQYSVEQKQLIFDRIAEGYAALGKALPVAKFDNHEVEIKSLTAEAFDDLQYSQISFKSGEADIVTGQFLLKDVENVCTALDYFKKQKNIPENVHVALKHLWGYLDLSLEAPIWDSDAVGVIAQVIQLVNAYFTTEEESDTVGGVPILLSQPEGLRKFAEYINERAQQLEISTDSGSEDSAESESETVEKVFLPANLLREYLDACAKFAQ